MEIKEWSSKNYSRNLFELRITSVLDKETLSNLASHWVTVQEKRLSCWTLLEKYSYLLMPVLRCPSWCPNAWCMPESFHICHEHLESIERMVHRCLKEAEHRALSKAVDHSHGCKWFFFNICHSSDNSEALITVLGLSEPILTFHESSGKLEVSNHNLTFKPLFKLVELILIIF